MSTVFFILLASLAVAALSTFGDFVWANWHVRHLAIYGVLHGMAMFLAIGFVLGVRGGTRAAMAGAGFGVIAGALGAGSFYVMRPLLGYSAMFASWVLVWIALGLLATMLSLRRNSSVMASLLLRRSLSRGIIAALASGAVFYAVSGMWFPFDPKGWDYLDHFARWTLAFLPGFTALLAGSGSSWRT